MRKNNERRRKRLHQTVSQADFSIRLPIATTYLPSRVTSVSTLQERMMRLRALPEGWASSIVSGQLILVKICPGPQAELLFMLSISHDFTWIARQGSNMLSGDVLAGAPSFLQSVEDVTSTLSQLDHCKLCIGNSDEKFSDLIAWREGRFLDQSGMSHACMHAQ